jgi:hypothetical protein
MPNAIGKGTELANRLRPLPCEALNGFTTLKPPYEPPNDRFVRAAGRPFDLVDYMTGVISGGIFRALAANMQDRALVDGRAGWKVSIDHNGSVGAQHLKLKASVVSDHPKLDKGQPS